MNAETISSHWAEVTGPFHRFPSTSISTSSCWRRSHESRASARAAAKTDDRDDEGTYSGDITALRADRCFGGSRLNVVNIGQQDVLTEIASQFGHVPKVLTGTSHIQQKL